MNGVPSDGHRFRVTSDDRSARVEPSVSVTASDYLYFVERALRGMAGIVGELGDDLACTRPDLPGANTAYGLMTHVLGVVEYWGGHLVAGREVVRDRPAEFDAIGSVSDLQRRTDVALRRLRLDVATSSSADQLRNDPDPGALGPDRALDQGAALLHLYEELAQHHGQLEIIRDLLVRDRVAASAAETGPFEASIEWLRAKRGVKWQRSGPELIPAWVADMDFPMAPPIRAAILATLDRGDLGYPDWPRPALAEPFSQRMQHRYGWIAEAGHVRTVTDLIQALQIMLTLQTRPGDGVVVFTPSYPPFVAAVQRMGRTVIPAPLYLDRAMDPAAASGQTGAGEQSWTWDHDRLEADIARHAPATMMVLVNPHNPTGKVFTTAELVRLGDFAERHNLVVVSDEIHAELTHLPHRHQPFAGLGRDIAARTVTVTSATKAFNIAGVRTAVAHVGPVAVRAAWDRQPPDLFGGVNVLGVEATLAAWGQADDWLAALNAHLLAQRDHLAHRLVEIPSVRMHRPDAGYLAWLDLSGADLPVEPADWLREHAAIDLSPGRDFGLGNEYWARLNFATTRPLLDTIIDRIRNAIADHPRKAAESA